MKTLYIDTHSEQVELVLFQDGTYFRRTSENVANHHSSVIMPLLQKLLNDLSIRVTDLTDIIIVNGPGSFTGVRLGVTIAKTLAYTLNIPIKTITSLEVMAVSSNSKNVLINDGNGYYVGIFGDNFEKNDDYKYINKSEMLDISNYQTEYKIDPEKVYEFLKAKESINSHSVNPIYIKKIGVEIDKESKTN